MKIHVVVTKWRSGPLTEWETQTVAPSQMYCSTLCFYVAKIVSWRLLCLFFLVLNWVLTLVCENEVQVSLGKKNCVIQRKIMKKSTSWTVTEPVNSDPQCTGSSRRAGFTAWVDCLTSEEPVSTCFTPASGFIFILKISKFIVCFSVFL